MAKTSVGSDLRYLIGVAGATAVCFLLIYGFEFVFGSEAVKVPFFWIQMATGSSWPDWAEASKRTPLLFALAATVHVMLNIGPFLVVVVVAWTLMLSKRWKMDLSKAFHIRDMDVKLRIKNLVFAKLSPEERKAFSSQLDDIFEQANREWVEDLTIVAGSRAAKKARATLEENIT
ncbi:hypothetical protein [Burkholderia pseudomallei]|uniref:hypothetical protein n=1 Tax=Burkholderia pseudomallei TaxID=28450 RepID=UPI000538014B|nr:hypothetical protein [Burkholderia pseudomallei]KGV61812.1 hypothetical protein X898_669 [Burkholderia pseudomallei ABCPW 91]